MLAAFLDSLAHRLTQSSAGILEDFRAHWGQAGRSVRVRSGDQELHGVAEQVDDAGHLHLRLADGSTRVFASAEVDFPA